MTNARKFNDSQHPMHIQTHGRRALSRFALLLVGFGAWSSASAQVTIEGAWARATVPNQTSTGAFMTLKAQKDLLLTGASSPLAGVVEVHEMKMDKDIMRMRPAGELRLKSGQSLELKSGGLHIMMMALKQQIKAGEVVPLTLSFRAADGTVSQVDIKAVAGFGPPSK